jgi:uncharacterized protein (UPF0262 family)
MDRRPRGEERQHVDLILSFQALSINPHKHVHRQILAVRHHIQAQLGYRRMVTERFVSRESGSHACQVTTPTWFTNVQMTRRHCV